MINRAAGIFVCSAMFSMVGCAPPPPYLAGFRFAPEPALAVMVKPGSQTPALSVLATVVGIRRGDANAAVPPAVEIRLRFENNGTEPASFDPHTLRLDTGSLQAFGVPEVHPPTELQIASGQQPTLTADFPFPQGMSARTMSLDALRLRWEVVLEGKPYLQTVTFERTSPLFYDEP